MSNITQEKLKKLIRIGARAMQAKSYHAVGIQEILSEGYVPKGSFYHYFASKEEFGTAIIEYYGNQISTSIAQKLAPSEVPARQRLIEYFRSIRGYYAIVGCGQGCLVAKLATEIGNESPMMRLKLKEQFDSWTRLIAVCIREAQTDGDISAEYNPDALAEFIYMSWEGALIRMQLNLNLAPLDNFITYISEKLLVKREVV